jgi:hypothetical protein
MSLAFHLRVPETWYRWDPDDEAASTTRQVDERVAGQPELRPARQTLMRLLMECWRDAGRQGAVAAAALWEPAPLAAVTATLLVLETERAAPGDDDGEIAGLLDSLSDESPFDIRPAELERIDLPAGRAVKVRRLARTDAATPDEPDIIVDMVQHWIPVPGGTEILVLAGSTPCLAVADDLARTFDAIAATVELPRRSVTITP